MSYELQQRYSEAEWVFISKGENRDAVEAALASQGAAVANIDGINPRCLHIG